jgi:membrane associated rhomboid family serine protease
MFITFVDDNPASKRVPWANTALILLNVFVCYQTLGRADFTQVLAKYGFIPARPLGISFLAAPFLHSSWTQLVANMAFLFMFGKGVEERLGRGRYLASYFLCSYAGQAAHWHFHPHGILPLIGASRAVTGIGVMYLFYYPWGRMKWIFSFFGAPILEVPSRTVFVMALWALVQAALAFIPWSKLSFVVSALSKWGGTIFTVNPTAGTAWDAHLGALAMGVALHFIFLTSKKIK